jgi:hypothetical protein
MSFRTMCAGLLVVLSLGGLGCLTRSARTDVYDKDRIQVFLRADKRGFNSVVEKGFDHPVKIAPVRLAYILSRMDMRSEPDKGKERIAAIPTDMLFPIANGLSEAFAQADANQEVVVMAVNRFKRWGVFDKNYLTSFVAFVRDDQLWIHLSHSEWEVPPRQEDKLPEPRVGDRPMSFQLYSGTAMVVVNQNTLAVNWRDPIFGRPTRTKVLPSGEVLRRTILLESPPEELPDEGSAIGLPDDLSPEQLRDLADVEELRRNGKITEADYRERRRKILAPE